MELIRQSLSVLGVLLLAAAAVWWLRRRGLALAPGRRRHLAVVERLALTPQHSLMVVRIAGRAVLIALSPAGCQVLEWLDHGRLESPEAGPCGQ